MSHTFCCLTIVVLKFREQILYLPHHVVGWRCNKIFSSNITKKKALENIGFIRTVKLIFIEVSLKSCTGEGILQDPVKFQPFYRMSRETFTILSNRVGPSIKKFTLIVGIPSIFRAFSRSHQWHMTLEIGASSVVYRIIFVGDKSYPVCSLRELS